MHERTRPGEASRDYTAREGGRQVRSGRNTGKAWATSAVAAGLRVYATAK